MSNCIFTLSIERNPLSAKIQTIKITQSIQLAPAK